MKLLGVYSGTPVLFFSFKPMLFGTKANYSYTTISLSKSMRGLPLGLSYIIMFMQTVKYRQATTHNKQEHTNTKRLEGAVLLTLDQNTPEK